MSLEERLFKSFDDQQKVEHEAREIETLINSFEGSAGLLPTRQYGTPVDPSKFGLTLKSIIERNHKELAAYLKISTGYWERKAKEDAKMKLKYCYALPKSYVEEFDLMNVRRNFEMIGVDNYDAEKAAAEGYAMAKWLRDYFKDKKEKFQLYDLRHYWGIKSTKSDLSTANAAESMGYSVKIHQDTYLSTFALKDAREVAAKKL